MEYVLEIGELDIDPSQLELEGSDSYSANHRFVVESREEPATGPDGVMLVRLRVFVCLSLSHKYVGQRFSVDLKKITGGGSVYIVGKKLIVGSYSKGYGVVKEEWREQFARLIAEALRAQGMDIQESSGKDE